MWSNLPYERLFCVYTPITQKVTGRFSFFFHYTKEHTFVSICGEFLDNPTINMAVRSLLRVRCRRLKRDRPTRETRQSQFCVYTLITQVVTGRFSKFFDHKIACTFLSLLTKFDANRT